MIRKVVLLFAIVTAVSLSLTARGYSDETTDWLNTAEKGMRILPVVDYFTARQNVTISAASTTITITLVPTGGYAAQLTVFGTNTSGAADTVWIYEPYTTALPTAGDSTYVLCEAGAITSLGVKIGEGGVCRFGHGSAGTPDVLIEGTRAVE